jgi:transcriptional regulator with XRE-family HTH domain
MIGERLITLRKDRGLTQKELSDALFVNYRTYSGYERNEIEANDDFKIQLAKFFNVSIDYLLGLTDHPHPIRNGDEYIRLPKPLSSSARKELEQYIHFLLNKDKNK